MSSTIGELSALTGVPIATLRDWDRRHGLSPSQRTIGNHRRYTEADAALVAAVRDLVGDGLRLRAAVLQARSECTAATDTADAQARALIDHLQLRADISASRALHVARREELVAAREELVARRRALVAQHSNTLAALGELAAAESPYGTTAAKD